ncbi:hypothetical protein YC2023_072115 [Brassica napus]
MINRDSRGHSYFIVRAFAKDVSLIKNESWGSKTIRYRPSLNHKRFRPGISGCANFGRGFQNWDVAVDGNVRKSGDGPAAGRALHVAWCPVNSQRPLKIRRTECHSRPDVLITASGLQGEQPLVDGIM